MTMMYYYTVDAYKRALTSMLGFFDKAKAFADAKKFDVDTLLTARLAPDMFPFVRQVQSTCDNAKGPAARLAGREVPKHEDNEKTLAELRQRVEKTLAYLDTFKPEDFAGCEDRRITLPWAPEKWMHGGEYALQLGVPNFYFHYAAAYNILRHNGVDLGKMDFLGSVSVKEG